MTAAEEKAIKEQLANLEDTKTKIRAAINNKGVTLGETTPFKDYAEAIGYIDSGLGGSFGRRTAAFPTPPEGNYGGGVSARLAWKAGEVATLINVEDDYPDTPTYVVDSQNKLDTWANYCRDQDTNPEKPDYSVVAIKPGSYTIKRTIVLDRIGTKKVFGIGAVTLAWESNHANNTTAAFANHTFNTRFAFESKIKQTTDDSYIQNIKIVLKDVTSKVAKNVFLLRGIEVESTLAVGDLFYGFSVLSRCFILTQNYTNITTNTLTWSNEEDLRTGAVVPAYGTILDVTIKNMNVSSAALIGIGSSQDLTAKVTRCYLIGAFNSGIRLVQSPGSVIDRCYLQHCFAQSSGRDFGMRAGEIFDSFIERVESTITANSSVSSGNVCAAFYAEEMIRGCKLGEFLGANCWAFDCVNGSLMGNAVVRYIRNNANVDLPNLVETGVFKFNSAAEDNCLYHLHSRAHQARGAGTNSNDAPLFVIFAGKSHGGSVARKNVIANASFNWGGYGRLVWLKVSLFHRIGTVEQNQIGTVTNTNDLAGGNSIFNLTSEILTARENYFRNISFGQTGRGTMSFNGMTASQELSGNFIEYVLMSKGAIGNVKVFNGGVTISGNRLGEFKVATDRFTAEGKEAMDESDKNELYMIYTAAENSVITENTIGVFEHHCQVENRLPGTAIGIRCDGKNATITKNYIGRMTLKSYNGTAKFLYGIYSIGGGGGLISENWLDELEMYNDIEATSNANQSLTGTLNGIYISDNSPQVTKNTVSVAGDANGLIAIYCAASAKKTSSALNSENCISVESVHDIASVNSGRGIVNMPLVTRTTLRRDRDTNCGTNGFLYEATFVDGAQAKPASADAASNELLETYGKVITLI